MNKQNNNPNKVFLDLEKLNELNALGYAGKFTLGETVVLACGPWDEGPRFIPEKEAVYDRASNTYWEKNCFNARKN